MLWYDIPFRFMLSMLIVYLLTIMLQVLIILTAGEIIREKPVLRFFRLFYSILTLLSLVMLTEVSLALTSAENGTYITITPVLRYFFVLPAFIYIYTKSSKFAFPRLFTPAIPVFFVPLLRFPGTELLPMPIPAIFIIVVSAWMLTDAVFMLLKIKDHIRSDITTDSLRHIIYSMSHGICIADRKGCIFESNPAFQSICSKLKIHRAEKICTLEAELKRLQEQGSIKMTKTHNGYTIQAKGHVVFLRRERFVQKRKNCIQLALSDGTQIYKVTEALEKERRKLNEKNQELQEAIEKVTQEAALQERERLCRVTHDEWSQKLAVAGLTLDILLRRDGGEISSGEYAAVADILESPIPEGNTENEAKLYDRLKLFSRMYQKLGVKVSFDGQADFSFLQQKVLASVLKESLANAVRHAYARRIHVVLSENEEAVSMTVQNDCQENAAIISEGRGLRDIRSRVLEAGGRFHYEKSNVFRLQVTFANKPKQQQEVFTQ